MDSSSYPGSIEDKMRQAYAEVEQEGWPKRPSPDECREDFSHCYHWSEDVDRCCHCGRAKPNQLLGLIEELTNEAREMGLLP